MSDHYDIAEADVVGSGFPVPPRSLTLDLIGDKEESTPAFNPLSNDDWTVVSKATRKPKLGGARKGPCVAFDTDKDYVDMIQEWARQGRAEKLRDLLRDEKLPHFRNRIVAALRSISNDGSFTVDPLRSVLKENKRKTFSEGQGNESRLHGPSEKKVSKDYNTTIPVVRVDKSNGVYLIKPYKHLTAVKPTKANYSRKALQMWAESSAYKLSAMTKVKTQKPVANSPLVFLLTARALPPNWSEYLRDAKVFMYDFKKSKYYTPPPPVINQWLGSVYIVGGYYIADDKALRCMDFKRNKQFLGLIRSSPPRVVQPILDKAMKADRLNVTVDLVAFSREYGVSLTDATNMSRETIQSYFNTPTDSHSTHLERCDRPRSDAFVVNCDYRDVTKNLVDTFPLDDNGCLVKELPSDAILTSSVVEQMASITEMDVAHLVRFSAFINLIRTQRTLNGFLSSLILFLDVQELLFLKDKALDIIGAIQHEWMNTEPHAGKNDSWLEMPAVFTSGFKKVMSLVATIGLFNILPYIPGVSEDVIVMLKSVTVKAKYSEKLNTIAQVLYEVFANLASLLRRCFVEGSFAPLFEGTKMPNDLMLEADALITHGSFIQVVQPSAAHSKRFKEMKAEGLIPSSIDRQLTPREYVARLRKIESDLASYPRDDRALAPAISSCLGRIRPMISQLSKSVLCSGGRMKPLSVALFGTTSVGKTQLTELSHKVCMRAMGGDGDLESLYVWRTGVNFQDGCDNTAFTIAAHDVDTAVSPETVVGMSHVDLVMNMVQPVPMQVESADLVLKGQVYANPLLFIYTTNYDDFHLHRFTLKPEPFFSRFKWRCIVSVKDEFATGGQIDVAKIPKGVINVHDITIQKYDPELARREKDLFKKPPYTLYRQTDTIGYLKWLQETFMEHVATEEAKLQVHSDEYCERCLMDKPACYCATEIVEQGGKQVLASALAALSLAMLGYGSYKAFKGMKYLLSASERAATDYLYVRNVVSRRLAIGAAVCSAGLLALKTYNFLTSTLISVEQMDSVTIKQGDSTFERIAQRPMPTFPKSAVTWSFNDLAAQASSNVLELTFTRDETVDTLYGTMIAPHTFVTVAHCVREPFNFVSIRLNHFVVNVRYSDFVYKQVGNQDMIVVHCTMLPQGPNLFNKAMVSRDPRDRSFDSAVMCRPDVRNVSPLCRLSNNGAQVVVVYDIQTKPGDCGLPVLAEKEGKWWFVGIHSGAGTTYSGKQLQSFGQLITQEILNPALSKLSVEPSTELIGIEEQMATKSFTLSPLPEKSEVYHAFSHGSNLVSYGTITPKVMGSTMKTDFKRNLYADDFSYFINKWAGAGYWSLPVFTGKRIQVPPFWISPHYHVLKHAKEKTMGRRESFMLAVADYLAGAEKLDRLAFVPDYYHTVAGAPGLINPVNLNTSSGPPYCKKKSAFISRADDSITVDSRLVHEYETLETMYEENRIVRPLSYAALKDEIRPAAKVEERKIRVFHCIPTSTNQFYKTKFGAVKHLMATYPYFFESWIGINITSTENVGLVENFRRVDPSLKRLFDGDFEGFDWNQNGQINEATSRILYALRSILLGPDKRVYYLAVAHGAPLIVIKNDLISVPGINVSGSDITGEENGLANSIAHRVGFYETLIERKLIPLQELERVSLWWDTFFDSLVAPFSFSPSIRFRDHVALGTYGDDNVKSMSDLISHDELVSNMQAQTGLRMTDAADKSLLPRAKTLEEISFLKRVLEYDDEAGYYRAKLDLKTLAKMLEFRGKSTLSSTDHHATLLNDVLRELFLHGREAYEEFYPVAQEVAEKHGLVGNHYLRFRTYDEFQAKFVEGSFNPYNEELEELDADPLTIIGS